jgi:elongation factor P
MIPATQLRRGMTIIHNGELYKVISYQHVTPGNWRGMVQTKLRNLKTGSQTEYRFRSEDRVERAVLEETEMEYLYNDASDYHFMNTATYEQVGIPADLLGDTIYYLTPNTKIQVEFYEGKPVGIELPLIVELKVTSTEPTLKGATVDRGNKPATLETGLVVQVPPFIQEGDIVKVDTNEGKYLSRA